MNTGAKITILSLLGIGMFIGWKKYSKPFIDYENIDFVEGSLIYSYGANGTFKKGKKVLTDKKTTVQKIGNYKFSISSEGEGIVLAAFKNSNLIQGIYVNFNTHDIIKDLDEFKKLGS